MENSTDTPNVKLHKDASYGDLRYYVYVDDRKLGWIVKQGNGRHVNWVPMALCEERRRGVQVNAGECTLREAIDMLLIHKRYL